VPAGRIYKDGALLVEAADRTVPDRRRLGFVGIASVALALNGRGELAVDPEIALTGVPPADAEGRPMAEIAQAAVLEALRSMPRPQRRDPESVAEAARRAVRAAIGAAWGKKPMCHVHVLSV
jgi:ribonuclease J